MIRALEFYQKSLEIREQINDKDQIAMSLNNIGSIYKDFGDPNCDRQTKECKANSLLKALEYLQKCLKLRTEVNNYIGIGIAENNIGNIYYKMGDTLNAIKHASNSLKISQKQGAIEQIKNSSRVLSEMYEAKNNFKPALSLYKLHIQMRDSLNNEETQKATIQQQTKYEYEKQKVLDDAEHKKRLAIEKEAKAKQKVITYATAGGLGLVVVFLLFVFNRLQVTRKQKNVIEEQKTVVEKAHHELEEKNKEITDSITYAKRIQSAILPPQKLVKEYLPDSFILYKPKDIVAGDFYWMETINSDESRVMSNENPSLNTHHSQLILFAAADCTGHGVPGAMVSVVCNNGLNRSVREHGLTEPGEILDKTREIVIQEFEKSDEEVKDGMDISLCGLDLNNNILTWSGANNPLWIIRKAPPILPLANGEVNQHTSQPQNEGHEGESSSPSGRLGGAEILEYKADKQPIGKYAEAKPFTTHQIQLEKGDSIYIFTDGYQDQFGGEKGKKFKAAKLRELLLSIQHEPMEKQREIIDQSFETWKGNLEQVDDVCVIGVKI